MNCNVLIVDDSPILRRCIKKVVLLAGVPEDRINEAGNGQEALDALAKHRADVVLLDLNMPVMDGEQFVIELNDRNDLGKPAIVIVSTEANEARLDKLRALGIEQSLHKPFEPEDLCQIIGKLTGVES